MIKVSFNYIINVQKILFISLTIDNLLALYLYYYTILILKVLQ